MKCPYCSISIHEEFRPIGEARGKKDVYRFSAMDCPACGRTIVQLTEFYLDGRPKNYRFACPASSTRPLEPEVTGEYAATFHEASGVLGISPNASAALSRRLLQFILRENGFTQKDLALQIQAAIDSGKLPSQLSDAIDAVRHVGNFAAHPMKSQHTGEIVDVEPGEAEWLLDTLEGMFDFYIVQPARLRAKRDVLNAKLVEIGKPPLKVRTPAV